MSQKKKGRETSSVKGKEGLKLLDPLEMGTVTFACDLYPDYSASFIASAKLIKKRAQTSASKKRAS